MRLAIEGTGRANGCYRPPDRFIGPSNRLPGDQRTKTLVYEAAH